LENAGIGAARVACEVKKKNYKNNKNKTEKMCWCEQFELTKLVLKFSLKSSIIANSAEDIYGMPLI